MDVSAPTRRRGGVLPAQAVEPRIRPRRDAVALLTVFLIIAFAIPSPLIFKPLGAAGTPADVVALGFLLWWALAKLGSAQGVDRGRQPVRIALLLVVLASLCSVAALFLRPFSTEEANGAYRGLVMIGAMVGLALLAADGISTLERLHTLVRRFVAGVSLVAAVGLIQWVTGYNPAVALRIPGLTRNVALIDQGRSNFIRVQSTTVHPIELGSLLGITLPIAVTYAFLARDRRSKWLRWAQVALIGAVLPMALSRTGVISATIGMVVVGLDWTWRRRGRVAAAAAAGVVAMRLAVPGLIGSLVALFSDFTQDTSTQDRAGRWQIAGHYFEQHPWFGMGLNTFYPATGRIFDNQYLGTATELGAAGLAAWILLFLIMAFTARGARLRAVDPETKALAQALVGVAVAMMVIFMTADMMSYSMEMGMFFLLFGATGALWRLTGGQQGGVPGAPPGARKARPRPAPTAPTD